MINVILIRNEGIGTKDHDSGVLLEAVRELVASGEIEHAPLVGKYSFPSDEHFIAFTTGLEAAGTLSEFAYVWEDTQSTRYDEQHDTYSKFEKALKDYL